jgi:SAM-dependent methyltransferase
MMASLVQWLDRTYYPDYADQWDARQFRDTVVHALTPGSRVLDFGAGRGGVPFHDWRGHAAFVAGVDVDPAVLENSQVHAAKVLLPSGIIPYPEASFDVVVSINVFEHVNDPVPVLREIARVLTPGGLCLIQTPNRRHYVPRVARLTPHWFHVWFNRMRGRAEHDTFPTFYRCNTPEDMRATAQRAGLVAERIECWEGRPEYLRFNPVPYLIGIAYERFANNKEERAAMRCVLIASLRKTDTT